MRGGCSSFKAKSVGNGVDGRHEARLALLYLAERMEDLGVGSSLVHGGKGRLQLVSSARSNGAEGKMDCAQEETTNGDEDAHLVIKRWSNLGNPLARGIR